VIRLLVEKGANIEPRIITVETPLSWAADKGHETVIRLLVKKDAALESKDSLYGRTPLSWAGGA